MERAGPIQSQHQLRSTSGVVGGAAEQLGADPSVYRSQAERRGGDVYWSLRDADSQDATASARRCIGKGQSRGLRSQGA